MKYYLFLLLTLFSKFTCAQQINYCKYFILDVKQKVYNGEKYKSYHVAYNQKSKDKFGRFLKNHNNRFLYILNKCSQQFKTAGEKYPDMAMVQNTFCDTILKPQSEKYFNFLTPKSLLTEKEIPDTFSLNELMLTASRFFYCDTIFEKDTAIQSHICIGINGQQEYKSPKDLNVLEAFAFEAIFYYITKKDDPVFYTDFYSFKSQRIKEEIKHFTSFHSMLLAVRKSCYEYMQDNSNLQSCLLSYYKKNKANLNFTISTK